ESGVAVGRITGSELVDVGNSRNARRRIEREHERRRVVSRHREEMLEPGLLQPGDQIFSYVHDSAHVHLVETTWRHRLQRLGAVCALAFDATLQAAAARTWVGQERIPFFQPGRMSEAEKLLER